MITMVLPLKWYVQCADMCLPFRDFFSIFGTEMMGFHHKLWKLF